MFLEGRVVHVYSERVQILDDEHCRGARVSLAEGMNLPYARCELGDVFRDLVPRHPLIREGGFAVKVIIERLPYELPRSVEH